MASPDGSKAKVAGTGAIWYAPTGTALPTDSTTALNAAFVNVGFVKDGFQVAQNMTTKEIMGWQSLDVLRLIRTQVSRSVKFTAIESNKTSVQLAWGNATVTVATSPAYQLTFPTNQVSPEGVMVLDWSDGSATQRIVIKRAALKSLPTITVTRQDAVSYDLEVQALAPTDGTDAIVTYGSDAGVVA